MMFQLVSSYQHIGACPVNAEVGNRDKSFVTAKFRIVHRVRLVFFKHEQRINDNVEQYNDKQEF